LTGDIERRIADAYARVHELGVIHGDIRPENILILKDCSVRIIDFDCSILAPEELTGNLAMQGDQEIFKMFDELKGTGDKSGHTDGCSP
jgi:serine/threonine protein kinase